jgi:hypothetical protein|tara:strand:- start:264 stop:395 length:132 start_codon:yes stop_codon:yes gene_type:complete
LAEGASLIANIDKLVMFDAIQDLKYADEKLSAQVTHDPLSAAD